MTIRRRKRRRVKPVRRETEASRKLMSTRFAARLNLSQLATLMNVHPRTIKRWEVGETQPSAAEWARLTVAIAQFVPQAAVDLAQLVGVASPIPPPRIVDVRVIEDAMMNAADRLDVSPGRVRAAIRDLLAAVASAQGTIDDLARVAQERVRDDASGGGAR